MVSGACQVDVCIKARCRIDVEVGAPIDCTVFTGKSGVTHFLVAFKVDIVTDQELTPNMNDIAAIEWVGITEILKRNMHEGSRLIVENLPTNKVPASDESI
jgi:hypothetical protein